MPHDTRHLRIHVLGAPRIVWKGEPLDVARRQVRAMLYRLAVSDRPLTRDELSFLFWPDVPQARARRSLTHLLTHLRRTLPDHSVMLVSRQHVGLDRGRVWTDTDAFARHMEEWRSGGSAQRLRDAVDLYRGTFLAGFSLPSSPEFEMWLSTERQRWERLHLDALRHLVDSYTSQGMLEDAIRYARRYLETDDLAEEMHRRLMVLYALSGNRSAALRQFEKCLTVLEGELGVAPLPETRALYDSILTGRPLDLGLPSLTERSQPAPGLNVPLVGREDALERLYRAFEEARSGSGSVVLVSGEAGIGKSRLVQDFTRRSPGRVLFAEAHPGTGALPYHPIVQALRRGLDSADQKTRKSFFRSLGPIWLAELSRLLPELRNQTTGIPAPPHGISEEIRPRLFEALSRSVFALTSGTPPAILCLDDLHWADRTTLEWLAYLSGQVHGRRLLVIGTYRSGEGESLSGLVHHLRHLGVLSEIRLAGLPVDGILHILRHVFGPRPDDERMALRLHRLTGGNPFFLLETLRAILESDRSIEEVYPDGFPLPETVRQVVEARLARLSPQARQVLEAGSILDDGFSFDMARLTAGRDEAETAAGLEELVARQLLVVRNGGYGFHHDLARRAVEQGLNPVRRQLLHRRAARATATLHPEDIATEARHLEAGGKLKQAVDAYLRAVDRAQAIGAWREVEVYQGRSLALLDLLDPKRADPRRLRFRGKILVERAHIRFLQGRLRERDADLSALEDLAEAADSDFLRIQAALARSRYLSLDGDYEGALSTARNGLRLAERLGDDTARARLLARMGFAHYFRGDYRAAMKALKTALTLETAKTDARGEVLSALSYACYLVADYPDAMEYRRQALQIRRRLGLLARVAEDLTDMGILSIRLDRLDDAERYLYEALALARKIGSQPAQSYALNNLGNLSYFRGDYTAALDFYGRSLELQRATGSRRGESSSLGNSGMAYIALGDYARAEPLIRQSLRIDEEIGYESGLSEGLSHLARTLLGQGKDDAALDAAQRSLEVARRIGDRYCQTMALNTLAEVCLSRGEPQCALRHAQEAVAVAGEIGLRDGRILGLTAEARSHLVMGHVEEALAASGQAVALLEEMAALEGPAEQVYLVRSLALAAAGQRDVAAKALCRARAEVRSKAALISDPETRRRYLAEVRRRRKKIVLSQPWNDGYYSALSTVER